MRLLVTGLNGTLAPQLAAAARASGFAIVGWDRERVPPHCARWTMRLASPMRSSSCCYWAPTSAPRRKH